MTSSDHYIRTWLLAGIVLISLMVIIGGITRLTGSGLSMVEWKPVTGIIPPLNDAHWQEEFANYKKFPEYQKFNYSMTLPQFKQIYFWEYLHRLLGRLIGLVFLLPFVIFLMKGWIDRKLVWPLIIIFLLGGLQGFVGWYMVKSGLNNLPHVSHFRLATHQGMALLLIAAILWTALSLNKEKSQQVTYSPGLRTLTIVSLVLLLCQITLGAFVAGLKAGYSYNNFPWMGDTFFPNEYLVKSEPYLYNGVLLQFTHRWLGFLVLLTIAGVFYLARPYPALRRNTRWLLWTAAVQVSLGIATLLLGVPILLGVAHQFVAILLMIFLIHLLYLQRPAKATAFL